MIISKIRDLLPSTLPLLLLLFTLVVSPTYARSWGECFDRNITEIRQQDQTRLSITIRRAGNRRSYRVAAQLRGQDGVRIHRYSRISASVPCAFVSACWCGSADSIHPQLLVTYAIFRAMCRFFARSLPKNTRSRKLNETSQ